MSYGTEILMGSAAVCAFVCGFLSVWIVQRKAQQSKRKKELREFQGMAQRGSSKSSLEIYEKLIAYMERLSFRMETSSLKRVMIMPLPKGLETRFWDVLAQSGLDGRLSLAAFWEASGCMCLGMGIAGALCGLVFSEILACVGFVVGSVYGLLAPYRALLKARDRRNKHLEKELSEMLEVVALGMRSGLSFDKSFEMYTQHFSNELARSCEVAYRSWAHGLTRRSDALRKLASGYQSPQFARIVEAIIRSLSLGTSFVSVLESSAYEAREFHQNRLKEEVSKAPVKMMIPTAALILPAMLLLVLGPILLELIQGF